MKLTKLNKKKISERIAYLESELVKISQAPNSRKRKDIEHAVNVINEKRNLMDMLGIQWVNYSKGTSCAP